MVQRVTKKHATKACFSFANEKIKRLLKIILQSSVFDWTKENFDEEAVKRSGNGKFAKTNGEKRNAEKEHYRLIYEDLMDYIDVEFPTAKSKITGINEEAKNRERYSSSVAVIIPEKGVDRVQEIVDKLNKTKFKDKGVSAAAEIHPRKDGNAGVLITLFDHKEMQDYISNVTNDFMNTDLKAMSRESARNAKEKKANISMPWEYREELAVEKGILKEMRDGRQSMHMTTDLGYNRGFMFDEYIETLKDLGITDEELTTAHLFSVAPTSIRLAKHDISKISEVERDVCEKVAELMENFIDKAPKWEGGTLYRGGVFCPQDLDDILKRTDIDMHGASSWSSDLDIAESFADTGEKGKIPVIFRVQKTKHGASIATISHYSYEQEVVISSKARFNVVKTNKTDEGFVVVDLEEI